MKIIIIYFLVIGTGFISFTTYYNMLDENKEFSDELVLGFNIEKNVALDNDIIFNVIADIEKYPHVLPNNVISINIISQTMGAAGNKIFLVEETFSEAGVITTMTVRHSILPNSLHHIEIVDGDAKGTKIRMNFEQIEDQTQILIESEIRLNGILAPFGLLTHSNIESALNSTIDTFIEYAKVNNPRLET